MVMANAGEMMDTKTNIKTLQAYIRKLKSQRPSQQIRKAIERAKALMSFYEGIATEVIAAVLRVSEKSIKRWIKKFSTFGIDSLYDEKRSGRPPKLSKAQEEELKEIIVEQNKRVWTARHIYQVILTMTGVVFSVRYLPELLRRIGLSFHKTMYDLVKRDSQKRRLWIQERLPAIYKKKIEEGWRVFYQDEVGFSKEGTLVNSWGLKGKENKIPNYGRGKKINLLGVFEVGTENFYGELEEESVDGIRFKKFIWALKKHLGTNKILLICDNAKFHKSLALKECYEEQKSWLHIEFLPPYSPDFNPIERLWKWFKGQFTHNRCWKTNGLLMRDLQNALDGLNDGQYDLTPIMKKENERLQEICEYYETESIQVFDLVA